MKKTLSILLVTFLLGLFVCPALKDSQCSAQIRYYISKAYYDQAGVKHETNISKYITFVNNGNICYTSDQNGNTKDGINIYKYIGTKDGLLIYQCFNSQLTNSTFVSPWYNHFFYFTPDYKRLNEFNGVFGGNTYVYDQARPGDEIQTPTKFY